MSRRRILTRTILVLLLVGVGFGLSACGEPVAYGPDVYGPDVYVDGWFGGWDHRHFDHGHFDHGGGGPGFAPGDSGFARPGGGGGPIGRGQPCNPSTGKNRIPSFSFKKKKQT